MERTVGTHDGTFHSDEVTAVALLILFDLVDREGVIRTRNPERLADCRYVCDVGGEYDPKRGLFDHHQVSYKGGMSSAGMILSFLRDTGKLPEEDYQHLHDSLVAGIDAHDNGRAEQIPGTCTFSHVIANFNPPEYDASKEASEAAFNGALDFTLGHLRRFIDRHRKNRESLSAVKEAMEKGQEVLFFDRPLPWLESFFALGGEEHPAKFIVMPSGTQWKVRCVPPSYAKRMQVRMPLPKSWAGLLEEDLVRESGINGAVFCHKGRFTSVWETREAAILALKKILGEQHEELV